MKALHLLCVLASGGISSCVSCEGTDGRAKYYDLDSGDSNVLDPIFERTVMIEARKYGDAGWIEVELSSKGSRCKYNPPRATDSALMTTRGPRWPGSASKLLAGFRRAGSVPTRPELRPGQTLCCLLTHHGTGWSSMDCLAYDKVGKNDHVARICEQVRIAGDTGKCKGPWGAF